MIQDARPLRRVFVNRQPIDDIFLDARELVAANFLPAGRTRRGEGWATRATAKLVVVRVRCKTANERMVLPSLLHMLGGDTR